jgi:hypothetical protein
MDSDARDQQPIARTVGRRVSPPIGVPPTAEARAAWNAMAAYRTRVPKGVFVYSSHAEMTTDRESWVVDAIVQRQRSLFRR